MQGIMVPLEDLSDNELIDVPYCYGVPNEVLVELRKRFKTLREEKRDLQKAIDINVQTMQVLADRAKHAESELQKEMKKCRT